MNKERDTLENKLRHIKALEAIGFTGTLRGLRVIEGRAHRQAENYCNGYIDSDEDERTMFSPPQNR